ncbi:carboxypeptidase regulatory-like domain-containing protein, partial [SCandidatus Aminicenantes bacterium Aminicenantia_JdfR_composite]|nr:carboxypeptidase regulatory-like domain-containing protein [SCandidatus Aminicenantes bacterium Aminicenantia_JdfR_composite]
QDLRLPPGKYLLAISGRKGTHVGIEFELIKWPPPITTPTPSTTSQSSPKTSSPPAQPSPTAITPQKPLGVKIFNAPGTYSISALIDPDCNPQNTTFRIAPGFIAKNFEVTELRSGRNCYTKLPIDSKGFTLLKLVKEKGKTKKGIIYRWYKSKNGTIDEIGGPFNNLTLGAGTYILSVDGGINAYVELKFEVVSPAPGKGKQTGTFTGYVRTSSYPYTIIRGLKGCRIIILNANAPGLLTGGQPGAPAQVCDRVLGPATIFADYSTDSEGFYKISLPIGKYKVLFWAPGYVYKIYTINIKRGINAPVLSHYDSEKPPIKPGVTLNKFQGTDGHLCLEFDSSVKHLKAGKPAITPPSPASTKTKPAAPPSEPKTPEKPVVPSKPVPKTTGKPSLTEVRGPFPGGKHFAALSSFEDSGIWVSSGRIAKDFEITNSSTQLSFEITDPKGRVVFSFERSSSGKVIEKPCSLSELILKSNKEGWYRVHTIAGTGNLMYRLYEAKGMETGQPSQQIQKPSIKPSKPITPPKSGIKYGKEADLVVLAGDIDNLGFGWPPGFDVFSGNSTPIHDYPWKPDPNEASGTDRIMVGTSYTGHSPIGADGYTNTTNRPENLPQPIFMEYSLAGIQVNSAVIQMFVDDFQSPHFKSKFQVKLNGKRAPFLENILNSLDQTGPIGKLITAKVPVDFLDLIRSGKLEIYIDDPTTGAGDGFAIDFVRLLINPAPFKYTGRISGHVLDVSTGEPIQGAMVSASGLVSIRTDNNGAYILDNIPAGLSIVTVSKAGYISQTLSKDLPSGAELILDFKLYPEKKPSAKLINGNFSQGLKGWTIKSHGYGSSPDSRAEIFGPDYSNGFLRIGVCGGYHSASQEIAVSNLDIKFNAKLRVQRWSTFWGQNGGWAAVALTYLNKSNNSIGIIYYYLNPYSTSENRPGIYWVKLGTGLPVPTDWINVNVNLGEVARKLLDINPNNVTKIRITAVVFGTHEDGTYTIADFDDFYLNYPESKAVSKPTGEKSEKLGSGQIFSISGIWNTNFGQMKIMQSGNRVTGTYTHDKGKIEGILNGNILIGKWSEAPSYSPPNDAGDIKFIFSKDFKSFTGYWRYGFGGKDWSGHWYGSRVK